MRRVTTTLFFCVAALIGLGLVMLYSASVDIQVGQSVAESHFLVSQLVWCGLGLAIGTVAACADYRDWKRYAPWLLGGTLVLLALVLLPFIGIEVRGGRRWLGFHSLRFQPSEMAKLALVIFLAWYGELRQREMALFRQGLVLPGVIMAVVVGLVFVEPDRGCAALMAVTGAVVLVLAGVRFLYIIPPGVLALGGFILSLLRDPVRLKRIIAWLHPELTKHEIGLQAYQAMLAFGAGGWTGLGLGDGRQKLGFLPQDHTEFIFPIIGEELGLVATLAVLAVFIAIVVCGMVIASRARDRFGMLLAAGVTFLIGLQAIINIGVVTSWLPNKGMPLPFISYGGSNLVLMLTCVGLLISVSRFAVEPEPAPVRRRKNPFEQGA